MSNPIHPYKGIAGTPKVIRFAAAVGILATVITAIVYAVSLEDVISFSRADPASQPALPPLFYWMVFLAAFWAIVPPVWFWIEYYYIYLLAPEDKRGSFEGFKYGQQLATAIWAAILVMQGLVLSALF